jgi:hypothetical protein
MDMTKCALAHGTRICGHGTAIRDMVPYLHKKQTKNYTLYRVTKYAIQLFDLSYLLLDTKCVNLCKL